MMGFSVDDIPFPPRRPKRAKKKGSSGRGNGTTVGLSIAVFGSAGLVGLLTFGCIVWGHVS